MHRSLPRDPARDDAADEHGTTIPVREVTAPEDRAMGARVINSPSWQSAKVVNAYVGALVGASGEQYTPTLDELARDLKAKFEQVNGGSLAEIESNLQSQCSTRRWRKGRV